MEASSLDPAMDFLDGLDDAKHLTRERSLLALTRALAAGVIEPLTTFGWMGREAYLYHQY